MPQMSELEQTAYNRRWAALLLLSLSLLLIVLDSTVVNIAFPAIRKTFSASFADAEWVNSIYSLVFGAALITWGKLGDQFGRRNIFIAGAVVFVLGSLGSGIAPNIGLMILARGMQGMGGAMMSPSTLSIISSTFKGRERGLAFGIWGATAGVGAAVGPILGGYLIKYGTWITPTDTWRLVFLINVPIGILAIAGSFWAIQEQRQEGIKHKIDWIGIILASGALGSLVFGAIEGQNYGWLVAKKVFTLGPISYPTLANGVTTIPDNTVSFIPFMFVLGVILFVLFVLVELREERSGGEPLFEFGLLQYPSFRYGLLTVLIVALGEFGVVLALSIFFQLAKDLDAFQTGLRFLPFALAVLVAAPAAGALSSRFGAKWVVTAGMACEALSLFWLSRLMDIDTRYLLLVPPFLLYGVGVGLAIAQLANIVLSDIPADKAGVASGANNTVRQLGASLGIALIGAVLFGAFASDTKPLVTNMTAVQDFKDRAVNNAKISDVAKNFAISLASQDQRIKDSINQALDDNEGFDPDQNFVDLAISQIQANGVAKTALLLQGVNLDDQAVVTQIKTDLAPDADILGKDILRVLGTGFSNAGELSAVVAAIFVTGGALCSLMLPNTRAKPGAEPVMAH
jgi:MFS family permease